MSREIKFRAWLLKEQKLVNVDSLSNNKGYGGALEIIIDNPLFDPTKKKWEDENRPCDSYLNHSLEIHKERSGGDDFILMQYTGEPDSNGVDIYEGDIVEEEVETEYGTNKIKHEVTFNAGAFYPICMQPSTTFTVIGNLYENPSLIK